MHHRNQSCSFPEKFNKKKNANSVVTRAGQSNSMYMTFLVSAGFCNQHPFKKFIITWAVTLIAREGALTINFIMDQVNKLIKKHMWVSPYRNKITCVLMTKAAWSSPPCMGMSDMYWASPDVWGKMHTTLLSIPWCTFWFKYNSYLNLQRTTTRTMGGVVSHVKTEAIVYSTFAKRLLLHWAQSSEYNILYPLIY